MQRIALIIHGNLESVIAMDKKTLLPHFFIVFTSEVDHRPYGNHQLDSHFLKLPDHRIRIRPIRRIKSPVSLQRPMEEIDHNHRNRKASPLVLPCHAEQFFLRLVAKFTLPVTHSIIRHHRNFSGRICICLFNLCRSISCRNPIIELFSGSCLPGRDIFSEVHSSDSRIVPEKAISETGQCKRNRCLRISMRQLKVGSFHIKIWLLVLSHSEYFLIRI